MSSNDIGTSSDDIFTDINYDLNDAKFKELVDKFNVEIKQSFDCSDYEQLVEYILKSVFQEKKSKVTMIEETKEMFKDKTEYILNFLWKTTKKIYNDATNEGDILKQITGSNTKSDISSTDKRRDRSRSRDENEDSDKKHNTQAFRGRGRPKFMPKRGGFMYPPPMMMPPRGRMFPIRGGYRGNKRGGYPEEKKEFISLPQETKEEDNNKKEDIEAKPQSEGQQQPQGKKKIRCKNWPHCKDPNCEYTHPTETCPYFPTCMYGDKCMYIHPNIPCKYGYCCTRIGCNYSHPAGRPMGYPVPFMGNKGKYNKKQNKEEEEQQ